MKQFLLSAWCAMAVLSLLSVDSQAQTPAPAGAGARHRGAGGPEEHARQIISKYDKDGDHALNATELAAFFEVLHEKIAERSTQRAGNTTTPAPGAKAGGGKAGAAGTPEERAARAIARFDKNGDGKLDAGELVELLKAVRERVAEHRGAGRAAPATPAPKSST